MKVFMMKQEIEPKEARTKFPAFPVVLVTTGENIIAIGMVHVFSFDPLMIGIGVHPKRHSYKLLKEHKDFGVNIPTLDLAEKVNQCGSHSGRKMNKFQEFGLTQMKPKSIRSVLVEECPVNMECKVVNEFSTGDHDWFVGEVVKVHKEENYDREKALSYWAKEYRAMGELIMKR
jgi:flavin reductase (DIM6/NTAB) family NADH-FMN oxidoreductase RutF